MYVVARRPLAGLPIEQPQISTDIPRIYIGPCAGATFRSSLSPCATRGLGNPRALSCASLVTYMLHPLERLSTISRSPHSALPYRFGHLSDFVRLSICVKRSTRIASQTHHRLSSTKLPQEPGTPTHSPASRSGANCDFTSANRKWASELARTWDTTRSVLRHLGY